MPSLGPVELMLVLGIVIVIFGAGRISELGGALGKSIREFRRSTEPEASATVSTCQSCATELPAGQPFCGHCGTAAPLRTPAA
jgi:sec-independent protein translocase protein TatA